MLLPDQWVEVLQAPEIVRTLDADQSVDGLPFMPEMARHCGARFRVAIRAEVVCRHPPQVPFRRLADTVVLQGLRCDGSAHGGCQLGCMLLWKEQWLRRVAGPKSDAEAPPDAAAPADPSSTAASLGSTRGPDGAFFCQATQLPAATVPGRPLWHPETYLRLLRTRTFTMVGLAAMLARLGRRRLTRLLRASAAGSGRPAAPTEALHLEPGEWVTVRPQPGIEATLDEKRSLRGLAFSGDMYEQCGRRVRVGSRVERLIDEQSGRLRTVRDTVTLEGLDCDRYLGCARGMPFLWREAWLERSEASAATEPSSPYRGPAGAAAKRAMDIAGSAVGLVVLSPLFAWTALAIAATDGLPILFRHRRPGLHERPFTLYKFRTMRATRPGEVWYQTDDVRLTRLGRFLRSTSIDELPELWNVLRGEMSLVGPRPLLVEYLDEYTPEEHRRHDVRPGVTGWAAIHGRHVAKFRERLALDIWYVDHWSLSLDLRIIAATIRQVLQRSDVSATQNLSEVGFPLPGVEPSASHDAMAAANPETETAAVVPVPAFAAPAAARGGATAEPMPDAAGPGRGS